MECWISVDQGFMQDQIVASLTFLEDISHMCHDTLEQI